MSAYPDLMLERGMPASVDAERSILGGILLENAHFDEAKELLSPEDFSLESHRRIFARMSELQSTGHAVDLVTLAEHLARRKEVESIGGVAYIASLTEGLPRRISIGEYVRIVRQKAMLRQVILTCDSIGRRAMDQAEDAEDLIASADAALLSIASTAETQSETLEAQSMREMERLLAQHRGAETRFLTWGIAQLDMLTGGLGVQEMTVLGGKPGQGKSGMLLQAIQRHCQRGVPCHIISPEMPSGSLLRRLWAAESGVPYRLVRHAQLLNREQLDAVIQAQLAISSWPLVIDDGVSMTTDQLVARARIVKRKQDTQLLGVDYLQKLNFTRDLKFRHLDVSDAAVRISKLAKSEDLAVLLLSSITQRDGRDRNAAPTLGDLRQSGDIQFEANTVLLLHREIDPETDKNRLQGEVIIAKARGDEQGSVKIQFNPATLMFDEPERGLYDR